MVRNAKSRIRQYVSDAYEKKFDTYWIEFFARIGKAINANATLNDSQWQDLVNFANGIKFMDHTNDQGIVQIRFLELNLIIFVNLCEGDDE